MFRKWQLQKDIGSFLEKSPEEQVKAIANLVEDFPLKTFIRYLYPGEHQAATIKILSLIQDPNILEQILVQVDQENNPALRAVLLKGFVESRFFQVDQNLIMLLKSSYPEFRLFAAKRLRENAKPTTFPLLRQALFDRSTWHSLTEAMHLAFELGGESSADVLAGLLDDDDPTFRLSVLKLLGELQNPQIYETILLALKDSHPQCRLLAVEILGKKAWRRALPDVIAATRDPDERVKQGAITALGYFKQQEAIDTLLRLIQEEKDEIKVLVVQALDRISTPQAIYELLRCLHDAPSELQQFAKMALTRIFQSRPVDLRVTLLRMIAEETLPCVETVFRFIDELGNPTNFDRIIQVCAAADFSIRHKLVLVLTQIQSSLALVATMKLFEKGNEAEKFLALDILAALKDPRTVKPLSSKFQHAEWWLKEEIITTLGKIGSPLALPLLIDSLSDTNLTWPILDAVGKIKDPRGLVPILRALNNQTSKRIALVALEALKAFREPRIIDHILPFLNHSDEEVRKKAFEVVGELSPKILERRNIEAATAKILKLGEHQKITPQTFEAQVSEMMASYDFGLEEAILPLVTGRDSDRFVAAMRFLERWQNRPKTLAFIQLLVKEGSAMLDRFTAALHSGYGEFFLQVVAKEGLCHENREVKIFSIELVKRLETQVAIVNLLPLLSHSDWWIQMQVAEALGILRAKEAVPKLIELLNNKDFRWIALEALAKIGDKESALPIAACLKDPRRHIRIGALNALQTLRNPIVQDQIRVCLEDSEEIVQQYAGEALRTLVQSQISYTQQEIAKHVREACGVHLLKREQSFQLLKKISELQHVDIVSPLILIMLEENITFSKRAIKFLESWGDKIRIAEFLDLLRETDYNTIMTAIDAISQSRGAFLIETLLDLIYGREDVFKGRYNVYLNRFAIEIAKQMRLSEAVPALCQMTDDPEWDTREIAIQALGQIATPEALTALSLLAAKNHSLWAVAEALGNSLRKEALPILTKLLNANDRKVKRAVLESIKKIRDRSVIEQVRPFLLNDDSILRNAAEDVLTVLEDI